MTRSTADEIDSHDVKRLKHKHAAIKESYEFAKEAGDEKRAKDKFELITKLEDKIESYCDRKKQG